MRYFTMAGATVSLLGSLFVPPTLADSVDIDRASWDREDRELRVRADGEVDGRRDADITVRVFNAGTGQLITSRSVETDDDGDWEFRRRVRLSRTEVPCRIRVEAGDGRVRGGNQHVQGQFEYAWGLLKRHGPGGCGGGAADGARGGAATGVVAG